MKVIAFLCNWCSYEASMGAGSKRLSSPSEVLFVRTMCTGMISPQTVIEAFKDGADGVMILGCHPGDCHYKEGNYHTLRRLTLLKKLVKQLGINPDRIILDWVSASESDKFAQVVNDGYKKFLELGSAVRS